jgi:prephenate dehydrogenase
MDEPDFFLMPHLEERIIAIVGLGLMGGSLALAMRGKCAGLIGIDPDLQAIDLALANRIVDRASTSPAGLLSQADLIVLAAPVGAILSLLNNLPDLHTGSAVVIDLGSTKNEVSRAMLALPARFDPLGGHPMCGKEKASLAYAEAGLYRDAPFALTPLERTSPRARALAEQLVLAVGARPLWMDAETHDRFVASTSHLPYLLANSLAATTPLEAGPLVGPGFRSTTRLAPASLTMIMDIIATNRENILESLMRFRQTLDTIEQSIITGDKETLRLQLAQGAERYAALVTIEGAKDEHHRSAFIKQ